MSGMVPAAGKKTNSRRYEISWTNAKVSEKNMRKEQVALHTPACDSQYPHSPRDLLLEMPPMQHLQLTCNAQPMKYARTSVPLIACVRQSRGAGILLGEDRLHRSVYAVWLYDRWDIYCEEIASSYRRMLEASTVTGRIIKCRRTRRSSGNRGIQDVSAQFRSDSNSTILRDRWVGRA